MNNWKIGTRISAGFAVVILIAAALGLFAYAQIGNINKFSVDISTNCLPSVAVIGAIKANAESAFGLVLQHAVSRNKDELARVDAEIVAVRARNSSLFSKYETMFTNDKDRQLYAAMQTARTNFWSVGDEVLKLSGLGTAATKKQAVDMILIRLKPLQTAYVQATEAEVQFNQGISDDDSKGITGAVSSARTGILAGIVAAILIAALIALFVVRSITVPLAKAVAHLELIAQGDLSKDTPADFQARGDEIGTLARAKQTMIVALRKMIQEISGGIQVLSSSSTELLASSSQMTTGSRSASDKAHSVSAAAEEMSSNITSVAAGMEQTTTNLSHVSTATEQMTSTIGEIAANSEKARRITDEANGQATRITEQMNQLGVAAREIGKVTEAITEISSQTNLLALNATIEAARAGSAGKGFAVVATEIKALAQQTAAATEDIKGRIAGVQSATAGGITEIGKISGVIQEVSAIVASIAAAIEEQSTATKDIARNIAEASTGVNEANTRVAETSQVSKEIAKDISSVDRSAGEMATGSDQVRTSAGELSTIAESLQVTVGRFHS